MSEATRSAKILIIDDEESIRFSLSGILEDEGYSVLEAESGEAGLDVLGKNDVDLVFLDIWLPGMDGHRVLEQIRAAYPHLPVLMISGHATIDHAVAAIKNGAHDFIEKPLSLEKVLISVARALEFQELRRENQALRSSSARDEKLLGESPPILALRGAMDKVAPLDTWVLITGENGTGKEIAARYIHSRSHRAGRPMVAVNCAAIPEDLIESELFGHEKGAFTGAEGARAGKFELAHQGTLFLDEIGDMSVKTQAKILRILQEQRFERVGGSKTVHVDVRVIAATNKNLEEAIRRGEFREDLYYRLRVFPLHLPPLRERGADILIMLDHFNRHFQREYGLKPMGFDEGARKTLLHYRWPGNVRELRNFVERMLIMHNGQTVGRNMLPAEITGAALCPPESPAANPAQIPVQGQAVSGTESEESKAGPALPAQLLQDNDFKSARARFEESYLEAKFREYDGNISRLAEAIGMERSYLSRKLKSLGIAD